MKKFIYLSIRKEIAFLTGMLCFCGQFMSINSVAFAEGIRAFLSDEGVLTLSRAPGDSASVRLGNVTRDEDNNYYVIHSPESGDSVMATPTGEITVTDGTDADAGKKIIGLSQNVKDTLSQVETNKTDIATKADKATTLAGYNILDAYTKTQVDDLISSAMGLSPAVTNRTAYGLDSTATADYATSIGYNNNVSGIKSTAVGNNNTVSGERSGAFGDPNVVSGSGSYAFGNDNSVSGNNTFVFGNNVSSTSHNSVILGNNSSDGGDNTVSVGSASLKRKIVNVADGSAPSDVATYGQLQAALGATGSGEAFNALKDEVAGMQNRIDKMGTRINKVGAGAAALSALHPVYDEDCKLTFSAGLGTYKNEKAAAIGAFYRFSDRVMMNTGATVGNGNNMYNVGLNFALDRNVRNLPSRRVLKGIVEKLIMENAAMKEQIANQNKINETLIEEINNLKKMFLEMGLQGENNKQMENSESQ